MSFTFATMFSGGGLADCGFAAAGGKPVLAVEIDPAIAGVYADNLGDAHLRVEDVCRVPDSVWRGIYGVDLLHASPVCTRASHANRNGQESDTDLEMADAICKAIRLSRPRFFTLENVYPYRHFESFEQITGTLSELGYQWGFAHVNAADYGVPQTRKRLILIASLLGQPPVLTPTHKGNWQGWYAAIEDLIPTLPPSALAEWQKRRLSGKTLAEFGVLCRVNGEASQVGVPPTCPAPAVASCHGAEKHRAVLVEGDAAGERPPTVLGPDEPCFTLKTSSGGRVHRLLLDAIESGEARVVSLTPRCLMRFQTGPDAYRLPDKKSLASTIIGGGVPCLLAQRIAESLFKSSG